MKRYLLIVVVFFLLIGVSLSGHAQQDSSLQLEKTNVVTGHYSSFSVDNMGNVYLLSLNGNQIKKVGPNGDSLAIFNDVKQYGSIYSIDVSNPLKILLYYRDFSTIVVLDRFLNKINKIDLRQAGIMQVKAVCQSYDNQVWVFDQQDYKLKKVGENGAVLFSSDDFRVLFANAPSPTSIIDDDGSLYLYDDQQGWVVMDYYGAVKKEYKSPKWKNVGVQLGIMYGWSDKKLHLFNGNTFALKDYAIPLDFENIKTLLLLDRKMLVLDNEGVNIYNYKL
ncbi:MAG: hypothetical protein DI598_06295 [Pseudopedobacter saltans]|uniref:Uncharacterized protein n=1 Tax=Pseudopedobacter saltans TaxID=151895 RepID=A0A2W5H3C4_9SPHI|nr:MAG: hypothetical protein DI598_06295 [Pseudopedobacter saltans]